MSFYAHIVFDLFTEHINDTLQERKCLESDNSQKWKEDISTKNKTITRNRTLINESASLLTLGFFIFKVYLFNKLGLNFCQTNLYLVVEKVF